MGAFVLVVAAVGVAIGDVGTAVASPSWSVVASPSPPAPPGTLAGVSCPTTTVCWAVGFHYGSGGDTVALMERWNGARWFVVTPPVPAGALDSELTGVSCVSSSFCVAVGAFGPDSGSTSALAELWNGTHWSLAELPSPAPGSVTRLDGVSCTGTTSCVAVGSTSSFAGTGQVLVEKWDGSVWSVGASPNPSGAIRSGLVSVFCSSDTDCVAAGSYQPNSTEQLTLIEDWDGAHWAVVASPNPSGSTRVALAAVDCPSALLCLAVGVDLTNDAAVAEQWMGAGWSLQTTPTVPSSGLAGLACNSATSCFAAGSFRDATMFVPKGLIEHWDGTGWSVVTSPEVSDTLSAVSCANSTNCVAVGTSSATLIELWNGVGWSIHSEAMRTSRSTLLSVSCGTPTSCFAVGTQYTGTGVPATLVERWNGTRWSIKASPNPAGEVGVALTGISCVGAFNCVAVGSYTAADFSTNQLIEHWNGTAWSIMTNPGSTGPAQNTLAGVSCVTGTQCFAVGSSSTDSGSVVSTLVERWDGTTWSIIASPNPKGATYSPLVGVACPRGASCFAVGTTNTRGCCPSHTLVEHWNGTAWSIMHSPNPGNDNSLEGVSCPTNKSCLAVGDSFTTSGSTLIESWNGSTWSALTSPTPTSTSVDLRSVSCSATTDCNAVGSETDAGTTTALIESWNGATWSISPIASPAKATQSSLNGLSCTTASACFAVGGDAVADSNNTLIERNVSP